MQRITDSRIIGDPWHEFRKFGEPAQRITLVTTMWDRVYDPHRAERQEEVVKSDYWKAMIDNGAGFERFLNTADSAWNIVNKMLEDGTKFVLQGDMKKRLATGIWERLFRK